MKKIVFLLGFLTVSMITYSQTSAYVELGGNGLMWSLNLDQRFSARNPSLGLRVGAGFMNETANSRNIYVPVQLNYVRGTKHALEIGVGATYMHLTSSTKSYIHPSGAVAYRYQGPNGLLFRAGIAPTFPVGSEIKNSMIPAQLFWFWPQVSLGYRF